MEESWSCKATWLHHQEQRTGRRRSGLLKAKERKLLDPGWTALKVIVASYETAVAVAVAVVAVVAAVAEAEK